MNHGKVRDMIRGILPSTARKVARDLKQMENQRVRRRVRAALRFRDIEGKELEFLREADLRGIVWYRRGRDKLNPFMRWCAFHTDGMSAERALTYVRGLLPRNLIGDHAYSHWKEYLRRRSRWRPYRDAGERYWQSFYDQTRHRLRMVLRRNPSFQAELNAAIKERIPFDGPRRLLLGMHDVDDFANVVRPCEDVCHCREKKVLLGLLEAEQLLPDRSDVVRQMRGRGQRAPLRLVA